MISNIFKSIGVVLLSALLLLYLLDLVGIDPFPKDKNADHDSKFISQAGIFDAEYLKESVVVFTAMADESLVSTPKLKSKVSEGIAVYNKTLDEIHYLDPPRDETLKIFYNEYTRQRQREIAALERLVVAIDTDDVNLYNNSLDDIKEASNKVDVQEHSLFDWSINNSNIWSSLSSGISSIILIIFLRLSSSIAHRLCNLFTNICLEF